MRFPPKLFFWGRIRLFLLKSCIIALFLLQITVMKKGLIVSISIFFLINSVTAQNVDQVFNEKEIRQIESVLSSDNMQGRRTFTPGIRKAADFIAGCFEKAGLKTWPSLEGYLQKFAMTGVQPEAVSVEWQGKQLSSDRLIEISSRKTIHWTSRSAIQIDSIKTRADFQQKIRNYFNSEQDALVWIHTDLEEAFSALQRYLTAKLSFDGSPTVLFVLADHGAQDFDIQITNRVENKETANVLGYLPGDTRPEEYVIFSAHYDHLGVDSTLDGDQIYNGANDDASGTTAVIALARYFSQKGDNARSLVFVTFTGEEEGGYGSHYFSRQLDPDKVVAMFNIEMIGTHSKWGANSAYITGYTYSDFGKILQRNLKSSKFSFYPDPYPKQNLFYRSDNATLARQGVPAHTISTAKMDKEPHYHKVSDEITTLDLDNMTEIIKAIALSAESIIEGTDTPARVELPE